MGFFFMGDWFSKTMGKAQSKLVHAFVFGGLTHCTG
jgi:hypothetical protein